MSLESAKFLFIMDLSSSRKICNGLISSARDVLRQIADEAGAYLAPELVEDALKSVGE